MTTQWTAGAERAFKMHNAPDAAKPYIEARAKHMSDTISWHDGAVTESDVFDGLRQYTAATSTRTFAIGDILQSRWGYDQTTVEFFQVVKITKTTATVQQIEARQVQVNQSTMTYKAEPDASKVVGEPIRRKIQRLGDGEPFLMLNSYKTAREWYGVPLSGSYYG